MRRREFIAALGGAAGWTYLACAQKAQARIAFLGSGAAGSSAIYLEAFQLGLHDNGLFEGRDYVLDASWADGHYERLPRMVGELAQLKPRVIIATTITHTDRAVGQPRDRESVGIEMPTSLLARANKLIE